jgi:hypothetical protein
MQIVKLLRFACFLMMISGNDNKNLIEADGVGEPADRSKIENSHDVILTALEFYRVY